LRELALPDDGAAGPDVWERRARTDPSVGSGLVAASSVPNRPGAGDARPRVGAATWLARLRTPDASVPPGRPVVIVATDITHRSGAFGPAEAAVFCAAARESLLRGCPLLFLSANAGARLGLSADVARRVRVAWTPVSSSLTTSAGGKSAGGDTAPLLSSDEARVAYLYLDDASFDDLERTAPGSVRTVRVDSPADANADSKAAAAAALRDGPLPDAPLLTYPHHRIVAVVGASSDPLGVESLGGSAAAAAAMDRLWQRGTPFTLVTGRAVGIGAYLARLGRRVAQTRTAPMILTGHAALNQVLGRPCYGDNLELGGPAVMGRNGVSSVVVDDDLAGVTASGLDVRLRKSECVRSCVWARERVELLCFRPSIHPSICPSISVPLSRCRLSWSGHRRWRGGTWEEASLGLGTRDRRGGRHRPLAPSRPVLCRRPRPRPPRPTRLVASSAPSP